MSDHTIAPSTNFSFTDDQESIRDSVREFARETLAKSARETDDRAALPADAVAGLAELGLLGLPFAEDFGGVGGGQLSAALAVEELAHACAATAITAIAHVHFAGGLIDALGSAEQKAAWLPALASGEKIAALAFSDDAGNDVIATAEGDGFALRGQKQFVVNAGQAGVLVIVAKLATTNEPTAFVAELPSAGIVVGDRESTLGVRGADIRSIRFDDAKLPASARLGIGSGDAAAAALDRGLTVGNIALGAMAIGISQAAFEQATEYSKARHQFDKPIASFQAVSTKLADMAVNLEAARHMVYHAARLVDAGQLAAIEATAARLFAGEAAGRITFDAIQVFGGNGYSREYPLERFWRDAKVTTIVHHSAEALRLAVADSVLGPLS